MASEETYVQVRFINRDESIAKLADLPSNPLSVFQSSGRNELNQILDGLLTANAEGGVSSEEGILRTSRQTFDFILSREILRTDLGAAIKEHGLSQEAVLELECIIATPAPKPRQAVPHEDWVSAITTLSQQADSLVITASYDGSVRLLDVSNDNDGICSDVLTFVAHERQPIKSMCSAVIPSTSKSDTGELVRFVTGSMDQTATVWTCSLNDRRLISSQACRGHERSVDALVANFDGTRLASAGYDTYLKIWSLEHSEHGSEDILQNGGNKESEEPLKKKAKKFSPSGERQKLAQLQPMTPMVTLAGHVGAVSGLAWSEPTELWSSSWDHTLKAWDLELSGLKSTLAGQQAFTSVAYSPLSRLLITGSTDPFVRTWDPRSKEGSMVKSLYRSHRGWISSVAWSPHSEYLFISGSYDTTVKMWDIRSSLAPLFDLQGHKDRVLCLNWNNLPAIYSGASDCCLNIFNTMMNSAHDIDT